MSVCSAEIGVRAGEHLNETAAGSIQVKLEEGEVIN